MNHTWQRHSQPLQYFFLSDFHTISFALDSDDCLCILLQGTGGAEKVTISQLTESVICNVSKLNKDGSHRRKLLTQVRSCNLLYAGRLVHYNKNPNKIKRTMYQGRILNILKEYRLGFKLFVKYLLSLYPQWSYSKVDWGEKVKLSHLIL